MIEVLIAKPRACGFAAAQFFELLCQTLRCGTFVELLLSSQLGIERAMCRHPPGAAQAAHAEEQHKRGEDDASHRGPHA